MKIFPLMFSRLRIRLRPVAVLAIVLVEAALCVPGAEASWPVNGVTVGGSQAKAAYGTSMPDGSGGWYVAWADARFSGLLDVRLQHLSATGDPAPGWTQQGILVKGGPKDDALGTLAQDGQGGALVAWHDIRDRLSFDVYVQRYAPDGSIAPGWPVDGARATTDPNQQQDAQVCSDGAGGAFVVWSDDRFSAIEGGRERLFCQHIAVSGAVASGWPAEGLQLCSFNAGLYYKIIPDGDAGCFIMWTDFRRGGTAPDKWDVYCQRLHADGSIAAGWQANGNLVGPGRVAWCLLPDGVGGLYAASAEYTVQYPVPVRFWISRFAPDGVPAAGWNLQGLPMQATLAFREDLHCAADSLGGVFACWDDGNAQGGDIYATHILPNGSVAAGWTPNGKPISDPADPEEYTSDVGPDGMGGAYFAWEKHGDGHTRSYVTHFDGQGTLFPGWSLGGVSVSSTLSQTGPQVSHDGFNSVLVYWLENSAMMAQRFETGGIVATNLSLASSDVRSDRVTLLWQGAGASGLSATVYRRTGSDGWQSIGSTDHEAPDRLRYEDASVIAGTRYAYRLGYVEEGTEQFTAETWIDVPSADVFALEGLRPNPSFGALNVSFSLPREGAATMELLDLAGRRVLDHEVGQLGRGRHVFRLDSGSRMAPGVYWLRLRQGTQQALTRAVVMR